MVIIIRGEQGGRLSEDPERGRIRRVRGLAATGVHPALAGVTVGRGRRACAGYGRRRLGRRRYVATINSSTPCRPSPARIRPGRRTHTVLLPPDPSLRPVALHADRTGPAAPVPGSALYRATTINTTTNLHNTLYIFCHSVFYLSTARACARTLDLFICYARACVSFFSVEPSN